MVYPRSIMSHHQSRPLQLSQKENLIRLYEYSKLAAVTAEAQARSGMGTARSRPALNTSAAAGREGSYGTKFARGWGGQPHPPYTADVGEALALGHRRWRQPHTVVQISGCTARRSPGCCTSTPTAHECKHVQTSCRTSICRCAWTSAAVSQEQHAVKPADVAWQGLRHTG